MKRSYYIILIGVLVFIALNTIFYINIYRRQVNFQTELLTQQIRICGNTIEKMGMSFENEVNFILFSDDITQLFNDPGIKEIGSKNLELFYSKYERLINKINVYDNQKNVYGLILDKKNNFVSDYYESQRQVLLHDRDRLFFEEGKSFFIIPIFRDNQVHSNIRIEVDFNRYLASAFEQYKLENTLWPWLISGDGEIDTTYSNEISIHPGQLGRIGNDILEGNEGSLIHTINRNGESTRVISVYYPVRLIRRDYGIAFSMKSDLFLQSIYLKTIIITIASLLLLALIMFVHFRIINVHSRRVMDHATSGQALLPSINQIPAGIIIINSDNTFRLINQTAIELLLLNPEENYPDKNADELNLDQQTEPENSVYTDVFGKGHLLPVRRNNIERVLFKNEWNSKIGNEDVRYIMLFDVTHLERSRRLETVAHIAKSGLLDKLKQEISVPISDLKNSIVNLGQSKLKGPISEEIDTLKSSVDLLENLIKSTFDFTSLEPDKMVVEKIPFRLREEINLAIAPFKEITNNKKISIITKIRTDVPDKLIGDPFRLRLVLSNLLENALETTEEGRILIGAEYVEQHFNSAIIEVHIEDTGKGYSGDIIDELFEPAHYSNPNEYWIDQYGVTGLRLAIAKQNIDLLKGSVLVECPSSISTNLKSPGTKCSFFFECSLYEIPKIGLKNKEIKSFKDIHCLVLTQENDPDENSYKIIEEMGISIQQRRYRNNNLGSVTEYLRERKSELQILFIIDKPEADGFILASELFNQNLTKEFYVIIASSNNLPGNFLRAKNYLVDLYLSKPFESNTIFEFIKDRFSGIPDPDFQKAPRGTRINSNTSILLAEDNLFNRKVAQSLFKNLGFEIDLAVNGNEVINMVKEKHYDIIFLDLLMPGKDGLQTAGDLRKLGYKMPIIALTAVDPEKSKAEAEAAGINDYIIKPASQESIRKILLELFSENA